MPERKSCVRCLHRKFQGKCTNRNKLLINIKAFGDFHFWWTLDKCLICSCGNRALHKYCKITVLWEFMHLIALFCKVFFNHFSNCHYGAPCCNEENIGKKKFFNLPKHLFPNGSRE